MSQEFNKVTTVSNFIKNLLASTYLPLIRTVRDFDFIIEDRLYIYKCEIIKCIKSGYLVTGVKNIVFNGERASYRVVSEYTFGEKNDKLCTNYISNSEGYDSITHERLGKYLRSLRDMYDLNLMPLYNCFSNNILQSHHISSDRVEKTAYDYNTKVYKVPIRFNTDYTICMDNLGVTTFAPAFIKNNNLILLNNTRFGNGTDATNKYIKLHRTGVIHNKFNLRFKNPFILRFNNIPETKRVVYTEKSYDKIDYLHRNEYYTKFDYSFNSRNAYYYLNDGIYEVVSSKELNTIKDLYVINNYGKLILNTKQLDTKNTYFKLVSSIGSTYIYAFSELPENMSDELYDRLFIGVSPNTGRMDTSYTSAGGQEFWYDDGTDTIGTTLDIALKNTDTLYTTEEDSISVSYENDYTLKVAKTDVGDLIFDSPKFEIICLWEQCTDNSMYSSTTTYYIKDNYIFYEYELFNEDIYNIDSSIYYYKDGNEYVNCRGIAYVEGRQYYAILDDSYVTAEEYNFEIKKLELYIGGFKEEQTNYYKVESGAFKQVTSQDTFDINAIYAKEIYKEFFTWREKDENSESGWKYSTDTYINYNKNYYTGYITETKAEYVYDITEENCALYDYLEDNLYLLIQVPKSYESSIVVLEGNYINTQSDKIMDDSEVEMLPTSLVDYLYTSNLKLMEMPSTKPVPFSDTLIEFLLWNAINNLDSINNNMDRLLLGIGSVLQEPFNTSNYTNYWYAQFRKLVSDIGRYYNNIVVSDNLGYVTKDLEQIIGTTTLGDSQI